MVAEMETAFVCRNKPPTPTQCRVGAVYSTSFNLARWIVLVYSFFIIKNYSSQRTRRTDKAHEVFIVQWHARSTRIQYFFKKNLKVLYSSSLIQRHSYFAIFICLLNRCRPARWGSASCPSCRRCGKSTRTSHHNRSCSVEP